MADKANKTAKAKPDVVRIPAEQGEAITRIANELKVSKAQVLRWAIDALEAGIERNGGKLVLPLNFEEQDK